MHIIKHTAKNEKIQLMAVFDKKTVRTSVLTIIFFIIHILSRPFSFQKLFFPFFTQNIAANFSVTSHHSMAWDGR